MPDVHLPHLDDDDDAIPGPSPDAHAARPLPGGPMHRSKSLLKIGLEVLLIGSGVFLGLMGEQWREHAQHRELAETSLRRFRTEILANRVALTRVRDYHATIKNKLEAYLASDLPKTAKTFDVQFHGLGSVPYERTAWDLSLANGSLAYVDPQVAFALSRVYTAQQGLVDQLRSIVQSTIYGRSWTADFEGYWRSVTFYFDDIAILEPALLGMYDEVLPQIDRALGDSSTPRNASK